MTGFILYGLAPHISNYYQLIAVRGKFALSLSFTMVYETLKFST